MIPVRFTGPAQDDLATIWQWIAQDHPFNASRYVEKLEAQCVKLSRIPGIGRPREDLGAGCRGLNVDSFIIVYRIRNDEIQVLRVLDGRRDLANIRIP